MNCDVVLDGMDGDGYAIDNCVEVICQVVGSGVVTFRRCPVFGKCNAEVWLGRKVMTRGDSLMCLRRIT